MAERDASTVLGKPRADEPAGQVDIAQSEAALRDAAPGADHLDLAVARSRVAEALFGDAAPIKVGRYVLIERAGAGGMGVVWSAWDPELGRPVALKLASSGDEAVRARARDEGRALARLSHPNVVPIYDVFDDEQGVFLVMELVKGKTLRALAAEGEQVHELVRAYRQAGEGLAAAHAVGLIHRDFKPDNAILGADGRVRVLDFGLAHDAAPSDDAPEIAGTPRYMAPEQRDGKPLTAAVDQYALGVALREAIGGPPPRWLEPIIARATADDPANRYSSMDELLRVLALDPRARWRRRAAVGGGVIALGAVAVAFTLGRAGREESPCGGGPALIAQSWGAAPRAAVARRFGELTTPYAIAATPRVLATLDAYASGWLRLHRASCEAHRRGEISSDLLDRRAGCLARRRGGLSTIGELARNVTGDDLPKLVIALGELPDLAACEDDEVLVASVQPPRRDIAPEATAITELLARADVERDAGHYENATRDADAGLARARAVGYRPLIARALLARGRVTLTTYADDRGAAVFGEATREALASGDEALAIEAFARQMWAVSTTRGPADAADGLPLVEAILERLGDRSKFPRALLHMNLGSVALARGDRAGAREVLERARTEAAAVGGAGAMELTGILTNLMLVVDDPVHRERIAAELVASRTRLLGPLHPQTLASRVLAARMIEDPASARTRLWEACVELADHYPKLGADVGDCAYEVAWLAVMSGDRDAARPAATLAIASAEAGGEPVLVASARAYQQFVDGDRDGAIRALAAIQAAEAQQPPAWWHDFYLADAAASEAIVRHAGGDRAGAARALATAEAHYAKIGDALPLPMRARRTALVNAARARLQ